MLIKKVGRSAPNALKLFFSLCVLPKIRSNETLKDVTTLSTRHLIQVLERFLEKGTFVASAFELYQQIRPPKGLIFIQNFEIPQYMVKMKNLLSLKIYFVKSSY